MKLNSQFVQPTGTLGGTYVAAAIIGSSASSQLIQSIAFGTGLGIGSLANRISRSLKALAKEIDVPVIALSQLNRAPETRTGKRPVLADLKDSGAIEQDADIVTFVFRAEKYEQVPENKGLAVIDIAKHRNGPTGTVKLYFSEKYTKFEDLALDDPALKNPDFTSED